MTSENQIEIKGLHKKYSINSFASKWHSFSEYFRVLFGIERYQHTHKNEFWVLKGVDITISRGESVAIVGKNGCGKSTLLKVIAGILETEKGAVRVRGNVQALINLGAGLDRNLTGRENILNACGLYGFTADDELVNSITEFAELGSFIDSPISTYSSGMYARLGFSLATSLKPDILLIDEILAVGDVSFKNKCMARIFELKKQGVSIVLVSHSHGQVAQLCERAIWINDGEIVKDGETKSILHDYLSFMEGQDRKQLSRIRNLEKNSQSADSGAAAGLYGAIYSENDRISDLVVTLNGVETSAEVALHQELKISYSFQLVSEVKDLNVSLNIYKPEGALITTISTLNGDVLKYKHSGAVDCTITINELNLAPGRYVIVMPIHEGHSYLYRNVIADFWVLQPKYLTWGDVNFRYSYEVHH